MKISNARVRRELLETTITSVRSTTPEPIDGYYTIRVVRGAVPVPARIFSACVCTPIGGDDNNVHDWTPECDRSPVVIGMICGDVCDAEKVWRSGSLKAISKKEYELLVAQAVWDRQYQPDAPLANPSRKVDFLNMKLDF